MIEYAIIETRFSVNPDGTQDRINLVLWNASKLVGGVLAQIFNRGTPIPEDYSPADKPYADVTVQDCKDWVLDLEDQAGIEAQLDAQITEIESPTSGSGAPWQEAFPLWAVGVAYAVDDVVIYQEVGYQVIQAHTSQALWAPPATPALWRRYVPPSEGPQPWVQPLGSEDAYLIGAQVTHTGNLWTSLVDANVWEPTSAVPTLWQDEGPYP